MNIIKHPIDGVVTPLRLWAVWKVSKNWRLQQRLPKITSLGKLVGMIR